MKIGLPIFMDDIATKRDADTIKKEIRNLRNMKQRKKTIWIEKEKYMAIIIGTGKQQNKRGGEGRKNRKYKCI